MTSFGPIPDQDKQDLSLKPYCAECRSQCCRTGSPIVSASEREEIVGNLGPEADYFVEISGAEALSYTIGKNRGGGLRNLYKDPCPYLNEDKSCSIQDIKPLDCRLYPLKPFFRSQSSQDSEMAVHSSCPAVLNLSPSFKLAADKWNGPFLREFTRTQFDRYRLENDWPQRSALFFDDIRGGARSPFPGLAVAEKVELLFCIGKAFASDAEALQSNIVARSYSGIYGSGEPMTVQSLREWISRAEGNPELSAILYPLTALLSLSAWGVIRSEKNYLIDESVVLNCWRRLQSIGEDAQAKVAVRPTPSFGAWTDNEDKRLIDPHVILEIDLARVEPAKRHEVINSMTREAGGGLGQDGVATRFYFSGVYWALVWEGGEISYSSEESLFLLRCSVAEAIRSLLQVVNSSDYLRAITVEPSPVYSDITRFRAPRNLDYHYVIFHLEFLRFLFLRLHARNVIGGESLFFPIAFGLDQSEGFGADISLRFRQFSPSLSTEHGHCSCRVCLDTPNGDNPGCSRLGSTPHLEAIACSEEPEGATILAQTTKDTYYLPIHAPREIISETDEWMWLRKYWKMP